MQTKLKQLADEWAIKADWNRPAIPEILNYNKQYRKENPDKYGYNADILEYIVSKENITSEVYGQLETEIYLSQQDIRKETKDKNKNEMLAMGYQPLTETLVQLAIDTKQKLQVKATNTNDFLTVKMDNVYRPAKIERDNRTIYMLIKPKARSRGYNLHQFENAFAKLTN